MSCAVSQQGYNSLDKEEVPESHVTKLIRTLVLRLSYFFVVRMPVEAMNFVIYIFYFNNLN